MRIVTKCLQNSKLLACYAAPLFLVLFFSSLLFCTDDVPFQRAITPPAGPKVDQGANVFLGLDFIYWTVKEDGLSFARATMINPSDAVNNVSLPSGTTYSTPTRFDPGFKVGVGLELDHDAWDTYLQYTWIQSNHKTLEDITLSDAPTLRPLWDAATVDHTFNGSVTQPQLVGYNVAEGSWRLRFNNFDLELGRNFFISNYLTLRPHAGLKGCWYRQNYHVNYTDPSPSDVPILTFDQLKLKFDQNFWGVGIRSGLDTSWKMNSHWSIFNDLALSALWGRFQILRNDYVIVENLAQEGNFFYQIVKTSEDFHTMKGVIENILGLRFESYFYRDHFHFLFDIGWEMQIWINHNQLFRLIQNSTGSGDLIFQGLTLKVRFDF